MEASPLKVLALEMKEKLVSEKEALKNNITNLLYADFVSRIKAGELVNVQVRGEVASGKSTVAISLMDFLNSVLKEVRGLDIKKKDYINLIFADQTEFLRWIKQGKTNIAIVIDENNRMSQTGLNATTEQVLWDYYSDVFAQKYIHRFLCSPSDILDKNSYLVLDVLGRDLEKKITRVRVSYRDITDNVLIVLGYADIDVKNVINASFYKKYREKKFKRMQLLEKHGVRDVRELEFSYMIYRVWERIKDVVAMKLDNIIIGAYVDEVRREEGRIYSLLAMQEIISKVKMLADLQYKLNQIYEKMQKEKDLEKRKQLAVLFNQVQDIQRKRLADIKKYADLYVKWLNGEYE